MGAFDNAFQAIRDKAGDRDRKGYDPRPYRLAEEKRWSLPSTSNPFGAEPWNRYWAEMEEYEKDQTKGRPVVPHRSA